MRSFLHLAMAAAFVAAAPAAVADGPGVDIGLYSTADGALEVKVIPDTDFDGVFASLLFTLRWSHDTGASLGAPVQGAVEQSCLSLRPSGGVHAVGPYLYRIYAGFGMQRLADAGVHWKAGTAYTVCWIPMQGRAQVELVVDEWTADQRNNGSYYLSLDGYDRTGAVVSPKALGGTRDHAVTISPNPSSGSFTLSVDVPVAQDLELRVVNSTGEALHRESLRAYSGTWSKAMDLTGAGPGSYTLLVRQADREVPYTITIN